MPAPKKAQRTKGNLKPSSSSQAGQLLAQAGHSCVGFIGFSNQPAYVPASEIFDDVDSTLDADFRLVLRKFSKKDAVTKIKALQEFSSLCSCKDDDCIKAVLPFWPRIYNKVAIDVDHKVRELSQKALQALAERAGKNLSPHLRSIMGAWMVSMCDTYPTVASAANSTFSAVFPPAKQTAAISFCKAECAEYFLSNIITQTPQSLSDPTTSEEDMKAKYQRVVSSSLQAMRKMVSALQDDWSAIESLATHLETLLSSPAFWKHSKSTVSMINGGVLSILSSICQHCPSVSEPNVNKMSPLVFSFMDSKDPVIVSYCWEALLSLINAHNECWQHVNWQKAVWPKLKNVLESGCGGHAEVVAPCLLPLLSKLPQKNFAQFFECFRLGLNQENALNSPSAMTALIKGFMECIHYCVKSSAEEADANHTCEIQGLVQDQILVVIEASLTDVKPSLAKSPLYGLLSSLVLFLGKKHPKIEKDFWNELSSFTRHHLLSKMIDHPSDSSNDQCIAKTPSINSFFHRLSCLVRDLVFQESLVPGDFKPGKVKFIQESFSNKKELPSKKEKKELSPSLESFISDVLVTSCYLATEFQASKYFKLFKDIAIIHIPSEAARKLNNSEDSLKLELFEELKMKKSNINQKTDEEIDKKIEQMLEKDQWDNSNEYFHFIYSTLLKSILNEQQLQPESNVVFTEELIIACFAFLQYLCEEDGVKFLTVASEIITSPPIMCQFIEHLISHVKLIPACARVLNKSVMNDKITELATEVTKVETMNNNEDEAGGIWKMLLSFVSHLDEGPFVSNACVDAIMNSCIMTLNQCQQKKMELSIHSCSHLMSVVHTLLDKSLVKGHSQFSELMSNLLCVALDSTFVYDECKDKVETALLAGFNLILSDSSGQNILLYELCRTIRNWVCSHLQTSKELDSVAKVVELLVSTASSFGDSSDEESEMTDQAPELSDGKSIKTVTEDKRKTLDNLLYVDHIHVEEFKETVHDLYMKGVLLKPAHKSRKGSKSSVMSLEPFALLALYNLRTFKTIHKLQTLQSDGENVLTKPLSDRELSCLCQLANFLYVFDVRQKTSKGIETDLSSVVKEIQSGVMDCICCMTQRQIKTLVETAVKSSESFSTTSGLGLEKCFDDLLRFETELHSKRALSNGVQSLQLRFLYRCFNKKDKADGVSSVLKDKAVWSGKDVLKGYNSACSELMGSEEFRLPDLSECMFGFLRLLSNCEDVTYDDKGPFFNQTLDIVMWLKEKDVQLLTGSDSKERNNTHLLQYNISVARVLATVLVYQQEEFWELTLCTLVEWIQFLSEVDINQKSSPELQALMASVCQLTHVVAHTFATAPVLEEVASDPMPALAVHQKTKTEWEEFFSEGIFTPLLPKFVSLATESLKSSSRHSWASVLDHLATAVSLCPLNIVMNHELPARLTVTDKSNVPDSMKTLMNHLCPLLISSQWKVQFAVFNLLRSVMENVALCEMKVTESDKENSEEEEARAVPEALTLVVDETSLDVVLMTEDIEKDVDMEIGSQEYSLAVGYLLAWGLQLQLFKCASNELRAKYAQFFKSHGSVSHLCDHLIRLMPSHPSSSMLEFQLAFDGTDEMSTSLLGSLAVSVYCQCLEVLPALVRTWWVDQNRKSSNFVDKFTTQYISNGLCVQQLTSSEMTTASIEDMTIRPRPAAREVSAVYEMAEVTVNMTIKLPENYPLGKVEVFCDKRVGVSQAKWDKWLLQLNIFLQHQNGSIVEGLKLWKRNIDKKFEGIDDCMICFSVIHGTTFQLPRLTCRTCRKKFHSSCLYKWFNTSQKSSCPLCRNLF